ncbi:FomB family phosphonate monophosphate kinase [Nonomuraea sp. NPDC050691]|uniref:FomB family phosphonate monophosphate kinase n=1 Tax=Nonomuraea sp. NPDC050691 TaxID=3155661 RepID=UPI0033C3A12C
MGTEDDVTADLGGRYTIRSSAVIDLNLLRVRLSSNLADFPAFGYFNRRLPPESAAGHEVDYEVVCVDLDEDPIEPDLLRPLGDRGFRADRFRDGFYITHHFGPPAELVTRGNRIHVFGRRLDRIVWAYLVKHLLTIFAVDNGLLHLKGAAFLQPGVGATLLFGRAKAGKTVFLGQACASGARYIGNTHLLIRDRQVHGVPTAMRVRAGGGFDDIIASGRQDRHLDRSEYRLDPDLVFGRPSVREARIRNMCVVDFNPSKEFSVEEIDEETFTVFLEHFALAVGTYGLKYDLLHHLNNDFRRYSAACSDMRNKLRRLARTSRLFSVNADMLDNACREKTLAMLAAPR